VGEDTLLTLGYQITQFDVYDVADDAQKLIMEESGESRMGAVQARCLYDSRDGRFRPSHGFMAAVETFAGTKSLGGDVEAWGAEAKVSWLYSPWANHVLNVRGGVSGVESLGSTNRVPLVLRRFLGGSDNLRGFEYRSVAPMDEDGNLLGGQTAWWSTIEYMVPVPFVEWLDISAYYDVGDVSSDAFRFSGVGPVSDWGVGLSIRAQNFPIRIDLAVPVDVMEGDPANRSGSARLSFAAGYFF
jgi:outer membrane protein insertion porin family